MSPALNEHSAIRRFERSDVIEIRDGITFDFYTDCHICTLSIYTPSHKHILRPSIHPFTQAHTQALHPPLHTSTYSDPPSTSSHVHRPLHPFSQLSIMWCSCSSSIYPSIHTYLNSPPPPLPLPPDIHTGALAVSCGGSYSFDERIDLSSRLLLSHSLILIWSFADPIHPQVTTQHATHIIHQECIGTGG